MCCRIGGLSGWIEQSRCKDDVNSTSKDILELQCQNMGEWENVWYIDQSLSVRIGY